jgi:hypothetical protein
MVVSFDQAAAPASPNGVQVSQQMFFRQSPSGSFFRTTRSIPLQFIESIQRLLLTRLILWPLTAFAETGDRVDNAKDILKHAGAEDLSVTSLDEVASTWKS